VQINGSKYTIFGTHQSTGVKINADLTGKGVDPTLYRRMIESLLYLIASRLDIAFSMGACSQFQANPKESHLTAIKCIIMYVNDTINHGIWYSRETNLVLESFSDVDWVGNTDDRSSTSGGLFLCWYQSNVLDE